jgi:hypothetical protein
MSYQNPPKIEFQGYIGSTYKHEATGSTLNGATKKKHLLYNHKPLFMFEDYYLRVCQFTKRKGTNFQVFSNMFYMCEIGQCRLIDQTIVLCQTLDDDVIICIPLCSVDWYIAWVFKIVRVYLRHKGDSPPAKQLHSTQWDSGGWSLVHWKIQHASE